MCVCVNTVLAHACHLQARAPPTATRATTRTSSIGDLDRVLSLTTIGVGDRRNRRSDNQPLIGDRGTTIGVKLVNRRHGGVLCDR